MIKEARLYCSERRIVRREPIYSANRFARLLGDLPVGQVTASHLKAYREKSVQLRLSERTIESSIADLIAIVKHHTGIVLDRGVRLRLRQLAPQPVSISLIEQTWPHCGEWLQQWIVLSYWTGLRLTDALQMQLWLAEHEIRDAIRWTASKTGHCQAWPVPKWLRPWTVARSLPFGHANDYARLMVRTSLTVACNAAGCERWTPKQLRQRSITEWTAANGMAGAILHGSGLGVMQHYVDPLTVLTQASVRLKLPGGWNTEQEDTTDHMVQAFRMCDPSAQQLLSDTAWRLATG